MAGSAARPAKVTGDTALGPGVAAIRAEQGGPVDWAVLAADLGYADQAHLTRDFTATIGVPPARYVTYPTTTPQIPQTKP